MPMKNELSLCSIEALREVQTHILPRETIETMTTNTAVSNKTTPTEADTPHSAAQV